MKVFHHSGYTIVQGKVSEQAKVLKWVALSNCEIMVDESDEDEVSYTVVSKSPYTTQAQRQADFQATKKQASKA